MGGMSDWLASLTLPLRPVWRVALVNSQASRAARLSQGWWLRGLMKIDADEAPAARRPRKKGLSQLPFFKQPKLELAYIFHQFLNHRS